ncbi:nitrite reductase cytochrome c biogenesis protein NrfI [Sulfurospirillum diekertiae]|uniref:Nitrite reductase cytochrome c biogenesis protein NrfI n=1 Tax=Sulfurospirillum diekertiae TaxID=1854492 RepID=A0A290HTN0_9BACT|nr:cytochrome c biogenesis protein CcsA [Sulfurospirillum diekertiae]ATB69186.1 nitrite reductase cytochrome c biogenesis protein NrfI [Sulfurospirillum diekertiae]
MKIITILGKLFFSYPFILFMLFLLGLGAGVATFVESVYDTQSAKVLIYDAAWYEGVMLLLTLSLLGIIYKNKMWKKFGAFTLHLAFVAILIGAGLTRYFGYEGIIHIREGMSENEMLSVKAYFQIRTEKESFEFPLALAQVGNNSFSYRDKIDGKVLHVSYKSFRAGSKGELGTLMVDVTYDNKTRTAKIEGGAGWIEPPTVLRFDNVEVALSWGAKVVELPFALKLVDFQLERYAGSMSPSSYASEIEVMDDSSKSVQPYRIFMNHPLTYKGYTFFQSSYDTDEKGTILEVNKDPGKWPTYFGYFLLCVGFVGNFFTKGSRFLKLRAFLQKSALALFLPLLLSTNVPLKADTTDSLELFRKNSYEHANGAFSALLVQDYGGRIKPISTEAVEIVHKITGKSSLFGLTPEQMILGMSSNAALWQELPIIKLSNANLKKVLSLAPETEYVSFASMFDDEGYYKLAKQVAAANQKAGSKRDTFDNDVIKFDEKLNIAYLTLKGVFFKFIPIPNDPAHTWVTPNDAFNHPLVSRDIKSTLNDYFVALQEGISTNQWENANKALFELKENQRIQSAEIMPSETRIRAEVLYNHMGLFQKLVGVYFLLGFGAFLLAVYSIFTCKHYPRLEKGVLYLFITAFIVHTFGLALRWYISGHAPWSDSYESMVYIGWSASFAGVMVFRKSILSLAAAAILAAIVMLVAHMSFVNPQITNLVPVLKSYWLSIHVSVITASYGFLGLGALLGLMALLLMLLKNKTNASRMNEQIRHLVAINEISLIIGLSMLTIGNFFGGIWANESWGRYWGWDPKETWSFVSIIVYALILHLRFIPKLNSVYIFSIASLLGYSSIMMTYFGVNFYLTGMHSYAATGESPAIPSFVYYTFMAIFLLCALAYRGRDVKSI